MALIAQSPETSPHGNYHRRHLQSAHKFLCLSILISACTLLQSCAMLAKVWPPFNRQVITATAVVNPDVSDRPSPIQIKVMQLAGRTTFDNLTFDQLFIDGALLLSDSLISESSLVLQPDEQITHTVPIQKNVQFIAIIAAYRNIEQARWKHVYPVAPYSHKTTHIKLDDLGISHTDSAFSRAHRKQKEKRDNQAIVVRPIPSRQASSPDTSGAQETDAPLNNGENGPTPRILQNHNKSIGR